MKTTLTSLVIAPQVKTIDDEGFTLIELIVVSVILSLLAAVALPNFIGQSGKARETEFSNTIGLILRAQQAYHWEKGTFANAATDQEILGIISVTPNIKYIDSFNITSTPTQSTLTPANNEFALDNTRAYSGGIYFNSLNYQLIICRTPSISQQTIPPSSGTDCGGNSQVR